MSVVGFDIGNENCVIAVAKQRGIDVILNDESKRETPAVVSFSDKQRFIGSSASSSAAIHPSSTISQIKRLIGRSYLQASSDLQNLPFAHSEAPNGGILIHIDYLNARQSFTPTQILAMLLSHLKQTTEKSLETGVSDCVISVPSYFTDLQRRAYLHAAQIAGLRPLRLMHDCTAIALGYGIYKNDFVGGSGGTTNVVFVDIGQCDTQVAVVSFELGGMRVLAHTFDGHLGGMDFDEVLFRHFVEKFKDEYKINVCENARACVRLRAACEKLKKVLSANAEAPLNIECLMDEKDVRGFIKRDEFEKLSAELLERISIPCQKALLDSGLSVDKIHSVELVGSGSRVPAITKILGNLFRKEPGRKLNASECVARGCALQCAMLSPIFRVREYEVKDSFPYSIGLASEEGPVSTLSNGILFPKGHCFPSIKLLTLYRSDAFQLEAFYPNQNELPSGASTKISDFMIGPSQVSSQEKAKVKVRVQLNLHGIIIVDSASVMEDHIEYSTQRNSGDELSERTGTSHHESNFANGPGDKHTAHMPRASGDDMKGKFTHRQNLPIIENVHGGMTLAELSEAQEKEFQLAEQDMKMERTKDKKNSLEAYVYETRNKLLNTYRSFATDAEKEGISSNLQQTEEWLYDDGDDETEHVYDQKLEDLKKMVDPIEHRYKDEDARAQATRDLLNCIVEYRMAVGSLPAHERDAVNDECNKAEQWLRERSQQQDALPKNADPVLWSSEIKRKVEALDMMWKHISRSKSSPQRPQNSPESEVRNKRDDMQAD